jgi:uncharacterized membrane protein
MKKGNSVGMILLVVGIIILLAYGLYQGFENLSWENIDIIIAIGIAAIIIGLLAIFISIVFEQQKGKKKMRDEIKKEDLEP